MGFLIPAFEKAIPARWRRRSTDPPEATERAVPAYDYLDGADHLVFMVNGLSGGPDDWNFAREQFLQRLGGKVVVYRSKSNTSNLTHDGIDVMGQRLADEILSVVAKNRSHLRKISFVAHSLGGLISRYSIGILYEPPTIGEDHSDGGKELEGTIAGLEPVNFITIATPHLGSRWSKQLPFLFGNPLLEKLACEVAHLVVGRTGNHLFLTDGQDGRPPLLLQMVKDSEDKKFMSALRSFRHRVAYANVKYDHMVGWRTSSIRHLDELPKESVLPPDNKYPHIVHIERRVSSKEGGPEVSKAEDMEGMMIKGLMQVTWDRVDVCFHRSWRRYSVHDNIQVKDPQTNADGVDVIHHMIENFQL